MLSFVSPTTSFGRSTFHLKSFRNPAFPHNKRSTHEHFVCRESRKDNRDSIDNIFNERTQLITFDATDTLFELRAEVGVYYREAWVKSSRLSNLPLPSPLPAAEEFTKAFLKSFKEMNKKFPCFGAQDDMKSKEWWRQVVLNTYLCADIEDEIIRHQRKEMGMFDDMFDSLYMDIFTTLQAWKLRPGVHEVLQALSSRRTEEQQQPNGLTRAPLVLAVLSNNDDRLSKILENLGVLKYFDHVFTSSEMGVSKPDRQIFDMVLSELQLKCDPNQCIHVGDTFKKDVIGAVDAGWHAIYIPNKRVKKLGNENNFSVAFSEFDDLFGMLQICD